jgi:hyaluronate lyase
LTPVPLNEDAFAQLRPEVRVCDASVRGGQFADRNFGIAPYLMVKHSIPDFTWESYVCFDLAGVKGQVRSARVRLMPVNIGMRLTNAAAVVADQPWGETSLTWDTRPATGPTLATWTPAVGEPVEFDVSSAVHDALAADKRLTLRLFAPQLRRGNSFVQYGSRRGPADARPQLLITFAP